MVKLPPSSSPPVCEWSTETVSVWLRENELDEEYVRLFAAHKIDGPVLLRLNETDLREPPMRMTVLGDIKRIGIALDALRRRENYNGGKNGLSSTTTTTTNNSAPTTSEFRNDENTTTTTTTNGFSASSADLGLVGGSNPLRETQSAPPPPIPRNQHSSNSVFLISRIESPDTEFKSLLKTLVAFLHCCISLLSTSFVMVIVHDRVPDMKTYPPLPDIFLDNLPLIPWAFEVCELLACVLGVILLLVVFFHKHRLILLRRMFSLTGTVFYLRCVTMLITSLSVPGVHLECKTQSFGDIYGKARQALRIWYGMGMSLRGVRSCGDYMFSGHTTAITLLNHFITEYTPDDWHNLHTASWVMNLFSIFFILAGHEHYSIDVFIAFYISSRLFLYYHSMAYHASSLAESDARMRAWFPLFWFFESGGQVGRVPNEFAVPFSEQFSRWWWPVEPGDDHHRNQQQQGGGGVKGRRNSSKVRFEIGGSGGSLVSATTNNSAAATSNSNPSSAAGESKNKSKKKTKTG